MAKIVTVNVPPKAAPAPAAGTVLTETMNIGNIGKGKKVKKAKKMKPVIKPGM